MQAHVQRIHTPWAPGCVIHRASGDLLRSSDWSQAPGMDLRLIARQGVFSTADAARAGLDANALRRLSRAGRCVRLTRGWFAALDEGPLDPLERHRLTAVAVGREHHHRAAVSHHSMLVVAGLPTYAADLGTVHLTSVVDRDRPRAPSVTSTEKNAHEVPDQSSTPDGADGSESARVRCNVTVRRRGVTIHEPLAGLRRPSCEADGPVIRPRVVPIAVAAAQAGLLAGPEAFLVPADAALRTGRTSVADLAAAVEMLAGHAGIGPVRAALPWVEPLHESPGETRTGYVLRSLGFVLERQVELVVEGRLFRPDFRISGTRVLVEFDGALKYENRAVLFAEKQREDALRRAGWVVVRVTWADLDHPPRLLARVTAALAAA